MNSPVIKPTVGRVVWFHPSKNAVELGFSRHAEGEPYAAIVAHVHGDTMVNLSVFDANGVTHSRTSVTLVQGDADAPAYGFYAEWMPFQKGQAAKTEAALATTDWRKDEATRRAELEYALVSGAAGHLANSPNMAGKIAAGIKTVLDALHPQPVLFNPHTGALRDSRDVASDPQAILCVKPGEPLKAAPIAPVLRHINGPFASPVTRDTSMRDAQAFAALDSFSQKCMDTLTLPMVDPGPDSLEREIQAKVSKGPRVAPADIEAEIVREHFFTAAQGASHADAEAKPHDFGDVWASSRLDAVTFCVLVLRNGAKVVGVNYGAIDPAQHSAEEGRKSARAEAVERCWPLLGFRLRDELARPVLTDADAAADLAGLPRPDHPAT